MFGLAVSVCEVGGTVFNLCGFDFGWLGRKSKIEQAEARSTNPAPYIRFS